MKRDKTKAMVKRLNETFRGFTAGLRGARIHREVGEHRMGADFEWGFSEGEAARLRIVEDVAEAILHGDPTRVIDVEALKRAQGERGMLPNGGENPVFDLLYYVARLDYAAERLIWAVAESDAERITERAAKLEEARIVPPNLRRSIDHAREQIEGRLHADQEEASGWTGPADFPRPEDTPRDAARLAEREGRDPSVDDEAEEPDAA